MVPSHPTPAQEETLETLHFAAMPPPVIIENRWDRSTRMRQKSKRTALERERQNGIYTSSCSYRIFAFFGWINKIKEYVARVKEWE